MSRIDLILLVEPWVYENLYLDIERLNIGNIEKDIKTIYKKYGKSVKSEMGKTLMPGLNDGIKRRDERMIAAGLNAAFQYLIAKQMNIFQIFESDLYMITGLIAPLEPLNNLFKFDKLLTGQIPKNTSHDRYGVAGFVDTETIKNIAMAVKPFRTGNDFAGYFKKNGIENAETTKIIEYFKDKDTAVDWKKMCDIFQVAVKKKCLIGLVADRKAGKNPEI